MYSLCEYLENCQEQCILNDKGWYIKGWSRAGYRTAFVLYPFKILIDAGILSKHSYNHVLITHQHADHTYELPMTCINKKNNQFKIYCPESCASALDQYYKSFLVLNATTTLNNNQDNNLDINIVNYGDKFAIDNLEIEVLKAHHDIDCNGYGFSSWQRKVKEEYADLFLNQDKEKIRELKNKGTHYKELKPEFCFYADSSIDNLLLHDEWKKYPTVIVECTTLDFIRNNKKYHTGLLELEPILLDNLDKKWIIIHVSNSLSLEHILNVENTLRNKGINIYIFKSSH